MLSEIKWIRDAVASKELVTGMSYFKVSNGEIKATDGRITAGHPWPDNIEFLVPGQEFEKIISRMSSEIKIELGEDNIVVKAGRTRGTIQTLNPLDWDYPGIAEEDWKPLPKILPDVLRRLRPFISENANHAWTMGITLDDGWAYATNNVALAGVQFPDCVGIHAILPLWAVEFIMDKNPKPIAWCWTEYYLAFRWENGAWMRSQLIDEKFPEQAAQLIRRAVEETPMVELDSDFREAYARVAIQNDGSVYISKDTIMSNFGKAQIVEEYSTPELEDKTTAWSAKHLAPVIAVAEWWSPESWPKPAPFHGEGIVGYVVGRAL